MANSRSSTGRLAFANRMDRLSAGNTRHGDGQPFFLLLIGCILFEFQAEARIFISAIGSVFLDFYMLGDFRPKLVIKNAHGSLGIGGGAIGANLGCGIVGTPMSSETLCLRGAGAG